MLKIGVDARPLSQRMSGIGRYNSEMLRALIAQGADEYHMYMPSEPVDAAWQGKTDSLRHMHFMKRPGRMLWSQTYLPYWAHQEKVDVFWGTTHRLPAFLPQRIAKVVTIHDLVWKFAPETMRPLSLHMEKLLMPPAIQNADRIVAVSASTAQAVEDMFPSARGRVRVIHLGTTDFPPTASRETLLPLGIDRRYFLFVGTLEPRKNLIRLLKAYASLPEALRQKNLLVIAGGKGWGDENVEKHISALGIADTVRAVGYVDDNQLATLYAHAFALAMPSLYEGFGMPIAEAMQFGIPVITSNNSSMPEVAGNAGLLVDAFDEHSIAAALQQLMTDTHLHQRLAQNAQASASRFNWENAARELRTIFAEAMDDRR